MNKIFKKNNIYLTIDRDDLVINDSQLTIEVDFAILDKNALLFHAILAISLLFILTVKIFYN